MVIPAQSSGAASASLKRFRHRHQRLHRSHHVLLVSAVIADARNFQVPAIAKISAPALATRAVMAAVPADADALSLLPLGNTVTQFVDDADDFMSGNAGILNSGPLAFLREHVTVANATGLHLDAHLSCTRLRNLALDDLGTLLRVWEPAPPSSLLLKWLSLPYILP